MSDLKYSKPPIIEAVIEIKFSPAIDIALLEKLSRKLKKFYPHVQDLIDQNFEILQNSDVKKLDAERFFRLSSENVDEVLIIRRTSITFSQLAPYRGWENFLARVERDFDIHRNFVNYYNLTRIGVRFINRIDIPRLTEEELIHEHEYLNIYPRIPPVLNPLLGYAIQTSSRMDDGGTLVNLNSGVVQSPLMNHISILLDQDIVREQNVPQTREDILDFFQSVRKLKNTIFEASITDKTRSLFNK